MDRQKVLSLFLLVAVVAVVGLAVVYDTVSDARLLSSATGQPVSAILIGYIGLDVLFGGVVLTIAAIARFFGQGEEDEQH